MDKFDLRLRVVARVHGIRSRKRLAFLLVPALAMFGAAVALPQTTSGDRAPAAGWSMEVTPDGPPGAGERICVHHGAGAGGGA